MPEEPILISGTPPISVAVRRSGRAKRLSLRVSRLDGRATLTLPLGAPRREGAAFVQEKAGWLREKLADRPATVVPDFGLTVPVEGVAYTIFEGTRNRLRPEVDAIEISPRSTSVPGTVAGLLRTLARSRLTKASDRYAQALGRPYSRINLRDTRSRWGSCSSAGALMYSWRLIMAPPEVLNYVAAHEVAHLRHMNHSRDFWDEVARLEPGYAPLRAWLRQNGESLHRYRFK